MFRHCCQRISCFRTRSTHCALQWLFVATRYCMVYGGVGRTLFLVRHPQNLEAIWVLLLLALTTTLLLLLLLLLLGSLYWSHLARWFGWSRFIVGGQLHLTEWIKSYYFRVEEEERHYRMAIGSDSKQLHCKYSNKHLNSRSEELLTSLFLCVGYVKGWSTTTTIFRMLIW